MSDNNIVFNKEAKEYVPKKKKVEDEKITTENVQSINKDQINDKQIEEKETTKNIQFNLNAKEYVPTKKENEIDGYKIEGLDEDDEEDDEEAGEDQIIDDLVNQELDEPLDPYNLDEEESDDEKWFPKYKDCTCCEGYIYKCSGDVCTSLGVCFCKAQEDYDPEAN